MIQRLAQDKNDTSTLIQFSGKIFTVGGSLNYLSGSGSNRSYVIDVNRNRAKVSRSGNMKYGRALMNSFLLPTGDVVVVGGRAKPDNIFSDRSSQLHPELWNHATGTFTTLKQINIPRNITALPY